MPSTKEIKPKRNWKKVKNAINKPSHNLKRQQKKQMKIVKLKKIIVIKNIQVKLIY